MGTTGQEATVVCQSRRIGNRTTGDGVVPVVDMTSKNPSTHGVKNVPEVLHYVPSCMGFASKR